MNPFLRVIWERRDAKEPWDAQECLKCAMLTEKDG
jgi:hypothetical protein